MARVRARVTLLHDVVERRLHHLGRVRVRVRGRVRVKVRVRVRASPAG